MAAIREIWEIDIKGHKQNAVRGGNSPQAQTALDHSPFFFRAFGREEASHLGFWQERQPLLIFNAFGN